jgi:predicted permease
MRSDVTMPARALLRLLPRADRERATADLADLEAAATERRGRAAAWRAALGEAVMIVLWAGVDRVRRAREERGRRAASGRRIRTPFRGGGSDLGFALRALRRRPGFSFLAIGLLGLGIGANVAIFTLVNRLFLEPPPLVREPSELVRVFRSSASGYGSSLSYPDYRDFRLQARSLGSLVAYSGGFAVTARVGGESVQLQVAAVSDNYFGGLGLLPARGRFFQPEENLTPDTHPVAVLSWRLWQDRFGGAADVAGRMVTLNGRPFTVVGVAPRGFRGVAPGELTPDAYIPVMMRAAISPRSDTAWRERLPDHRESWLTVLGRLEPGASLAQAQAELATLFARIYPPRAGRSPESVYLSEQYRWYPATRDSLASLTRLLLVAVSVLLAVAAANVAILLLARASARGREIGIRAAIGAGRARLLRQFLTESLLLGLAGGALGLALSIGAARVAGSLLPVRLDPPPAPDGRVLLFALGLSVVTAVIVGAVPALRASRSDVVGMIQGRSEGAGGGRMRDGLVVLQVALSLVLVAAAALFARSLAAARAVDPGFDPRNALLVETDLRTRGYDGSRGRSFARETLARIAALPGVDAATTTAVVPFQSEWSTTVEPWPGAAFAGGQSSIDIYLDVVSPGYFDAMRIPVLRGRGIEAGDVEGAPRAVVINERLARLAFGAADPIGRTIPLGGQDEAAYQVVGLVRDGTYFEFGEAPRPMAYGSLMQGFRFDLTFIVKTAGDPVALAGAVQRAIHGVDGDLPFRQVQTLESLYARQLAGYRASASVVGLAGLIALVLASAGLYGVMAYRVTERTREIGVRMALGATRRVVAREVIGRAVRLTLGGVALGVGGAVLVGRFAEGLVYGVAPRDPVSLVAAPLVLIVVAVLAVAVPARRAMAVDPMRAIRSD